MPGDRPRTNQRVTFEIDWSSFDNDDLADEDEPNPEPDEGWYVDGKFIGGSGFTIGPDHYGPGFATVDEALELIEKWATDRGYRYERPMITVTVFKERERD